MMVSFLRSGLLSRSLLGEAFSPRNGQIVCSGCSVQQPSSCGEDSESNVSDSNSLQPLQEASEQQTTACRRAGIITQNLIVPLSTADATGTPSRSSGAERLGAARATGGAVSAFEKMDFSRDAFEDEMTRCIHEIEKLQGFQPDDYMISSNKSPVVGMFRDSGGRKKTKPGYSRTMSDGGERDSILNAAPTERLGTGGGVGQQHHHHHNHHHLRHKRTKNSRYSRDGQGLVTETAAAATDAAYGPNGESDSTDPGAASLSSRIPGVQFDAVSGKGGSSFNGVRCRGTSGYVSDTTAGHQKTDHPVQNNTVVEASPAADCPSMSTSVGNGTPRPTRVPKLGIRQLRHAISAAAVPHDTNDDSSDTGVIPSQRLPSTTTTTTTTTSGGRVRTDGYYSDIDHRDTWRRRQGRSASGDLGHAVNGRYGYGYDSVERYLAAQSNWDHCSTCSSSSDSEFDYYLDRPGGTLSEADKWSRIAQTGFQQQQQQQHKERRQKFNSKHCVVS